MSDVVHHVLIIDDEAMIRRSLRAGFELQGFDVDEAETAAEGIRLARLKPRDLVTVDLALPDMDGGEIVRHLREWSDVPLIVLSVRADEAEKVRLLELGADDYVVKPFGMAELLARSRAAMRRRVRQPGRAAMTVGEITVSREMRSITVRGERIAVTPKEYRLLNLLAQHGGNVVTHHSLLQQIWGPDHVEDTHYLRMLVRNLRRKIERDPTQPHIILTVPNIGYRLGGEAGDAPPADHEGADS